MSLFPDKNLVVITSALKPPSSAFTDHQRYAQTIMTIDSVRKNVPNCFIVLADVSIRDASLELKEFSKKCDIVIDFSTDQDIKMLSERGMQSPAENVLLFKAFGFIKTLQIINSVKRIFKLSGRSLIEDDFDITAYDNLFGKFVFKTRIPSWKFTPSDEASHLLITRFYSMCPSLIDTYQESLIKNQPLLNHMDLEHAHYVNIPRQYLVEFDKLHCEAWLSKSGATEYY